MNKPAVIAITIAAALGVGFYIASTTSRQRENDEKMAAMQKQLAELAGKNNAASAPAATQQVTILGNASAPAGILQKERVSREIIDEGFKKLNSRDPQQLESAIAIFHEGIDKVDADNPQFYNGLGRALLIAGKYEDSLQAFRRATALDAKLSDALSGQGWALWNLQRFYEARIVWEKTLALNPKSLDALSAMAWIYLALGQVEKSQQAFRVLVDTGPKRNDWVMGLTMARASNTKLEAIRVHFACPDPALLTTPPVATTAP